MLARRGLITAVGVVAATAIGVVLWMSLLQPAAPSSATFARVGAPAPQISLPKLDGSSSDLNAERGKVVLVNFWATWCEPCRSEMPGLQSLADELQGQPFTIYAVDLQEDAATIEPFLHEVGWQLPVMIDDDGNVTRAYGVRALPATFLVDQQGVLRQQRLGPLVSGGAETAWSEAWLADQVRGMLAS